MKMIRTFLKELFCYYSKLSVYDMCKSVCSLTTQDHLACLPSAQGALAQGQVALALRVHWPMGRWPWCSEYIVTGAGGPGAQSALAYCCKLDSRVTRPGARCFQAEASLTQGPATPAHTQRDCKASSHSSCLLCLI